MEKKHRLNKWEAQHKRNIARYEKQITELFREAVRETASLTPLLANFSPDKPFSFDDYPITQQRVDELLKQLKNGVESVIANGVRSEWTLANNKNNELCNQVFGDNIGALTHEQYERYYSTNPQAVEAFINRKEQGLNLSDRVWKYTDQFKEEIELGLDLGLREGLSADAMSRQLRSFLNHPDALFRRVRDEHGILRLSKAAKAFHPGRGVYRSAYKNARRLAATESNIAYRTADYERWQQLDFVVGIRVVLSNNHTLNGEPFYDICDRLSAPMGSKATKGRGCYPKNFKFTSWHPLCRCHTETILKTLDEMRDDEARILAGEPVSTQSENSVDDVPQEFKDWIEDNKERIERAKNKPYFIRDNADIINDIEKIAMSKSKVGTTLSLGENKQLDYEIIKNLSNEVLRYELNNAQANACIETMRKCYRDNNFEGFNAEKAKLEKLIETLRKQYTSELAFTPEQLNRFKDMENTLGIKRGKPMTLSEADEQKANPNYSKGNEYQINCQTCAPTYVLRSQGFNVFAIGNTPRSVPDWISRSHSFDIWENADGTPATPTLYRDWLNAKGDKRMTAKRYKEFYEEATKEPGIYITTIAWKGGGAHATIIQRFADGTLSYIEPQHYSGSMKRDIMDLCKCGKTKVDPYRGIMRVDNKLLKHKCTHLGKDYDIWSIFQTK